MAAAKKNEVQVESLQEQARSTIEEARMVLPGIQAIFGFQLIAIFNDRFDPLDTDLKYLHLGALVLVVVSIALIMAPAAYDRIAERGQVSNRFINLASHMIEAAMLPLSIAICLDVYVVTQIIVESFAVSLTLAVLLFMFFAWWWVIFPYQNRYRRLH
jgi:hypothetical protein